MEFTAIRSPASGRTSELDGGPSSTTTDPVEKEHMFDKVVTPSDVGKLNRLVIPKQHAEKYFPLDSTQAAASSTGGGGGLLLSFEDRTGKPWRFRYSYWNSSQSYVMTKGWSRFVKEKRLDAGDTVSFGRGVGSEAAKGRLFIDWRRRPDNSMASAALPPYAGRRFTALIPNSVPFAPWTMPARAQQQGQHPFFSGSGGRAAAFVPQPPPSFVYDDGCYGAAPGGHGGGRQVLYYRPQQQQHAAVVLESVPVRMGMAAMAAAAAVPSSGTKRVRLFGVNLDSEEEDSNYSRPALSTMQLMSPASSTSTSSSSAGKARCSLNLDL